MGVDGWKDGWVAVVLEAGTFVDAVVGRDLASVLQRFPSVVAVAVDMPIGFPTTQVRRADSEARAFIGPRRSSVFPVLPRPVYEADSYAEALEVCNKLWGKGMSKQSYSLRTKVLEVARLVAVDDRIFECHPEVCFAAMAGVPLDWSKKTWNGQRRRQKLLGEQGIVLSDDVGEAGGVPVDDLLDAAACAWSADRVRNGTSRTLPAEPANGEPTIRY